MWDLKHVLFYVVKLMETEDELFGYYNLKYVTSMSYFFQLMAVLKMVPI